MHAYHFIDEQYGTSVLHALLRSELQFSPCLEHSCHGTF